MQLNENITQKIFNKIEGNTDCFNDVILFYSNSKESISKYNLIYFGGDLQDYEDEKNKSSTSWSLTKTGYLLHKKFDLSPKTASNVFIIRADYFHLNCFANYSNFVKSTDFGVPIGNNDKLRSWKHLLKLFKNTCDTTPQIDASLPIILCGFSKGCIVLNQLCSELLSLSEDFYLKDLVTNKVRHLFWLDGGHSGQVNSWIVDEGIIRLIQGLNWACYVTPYQMISRKIRAIEEYKKFTELLMKLNFNCKNVYYFKDKKEEDFDVCLHFKLLEHFDTALI